MSNTVLVVDDEREITDLVEVYLSNEGFQVVKCANGQEALDIIEKSAPDLAILDVMLPDMDGFSICRRIRETYTFPIIMLTAKVGDMDKIMGLTLGADDYVTKPFHPLELVARVKAQMRRVSRYNQEPAGREGEEIIAFSGLVINHSTHECTLNEQPLMLTPTEFSILWYLCANRGQVISSERLFTEVWGEDYYSRDNNTVMVHIRHLREKMHDSADNPKYIRTVWGVGYKIEK